LGSPLGSRIKEMEAHTSPFRALGFTVAAFFAFYATWALVVPLAGKDHPIHRLFPPHIYAIMLPSLALTVAFSSAAILAGLHFLRKGHGRSKSD